MPARAHSPPHKPYIVTTFITNCAIKSGFKCQRDSIDTQTELHNWIYIKVGTKAHNANELGAVGHLAYAMSNVKATHTNPRHFSLYCHGVCAGVGMLFGAGAIVSPIVCVCVCVCVCVLGVGYQPEREGILIQSFKRERV